MMFEVSVMGQRGKDELLIQGSNRSRLFKVIFGIEYAHRMFAVLEFQGRWTSSENKPQ